LRLKSIATIEDAEPLRNSLVQIRNSEAVRLPTNEYYIFDLIGCEVVTDTGRVLGNIRDVLRTAANDVYVVGSGAEELLLPAIQDVVKLVDTNARVITVTPTPGLLPGELDSDG
jgi:16S rRNA processing protein RimM